MTFFIHSDLFQETEPELSEASNQWLDSVLYELIKCFFKLLLKHDNDCLDFSSLRKEFHNLGPEETIENFIVLALLK